MPGADQLNPYSDLPFPTGFTPAMLAFMRELDAEFTALDRTARDLEGPGDRLPVGAGFFDHRLEAETVFRFLSRLRKGWDVEAAEKEADDGRLACIVAHNARRAKDTSWQRWTGAGTAKVAQLVRRAQAVENPSPTP